jgi:uncharacterized protein (DUF302 family)
MYFARELTTVFDRPINASRERASMRSIFALMLFTSVATAQQNDGIVRVRSTRDFNQTVSSLDSAITAANLKIFARVDHAANARGVSMDLRPTTVFIFGNPQVGTRLMQCEQATAIDLPLKVLVWQDSTNAVWVGHEAPAKLSQRHKLQGCQEVIDRMATALAGLTATATGTTRR